MFLKKNISLRGVFTRTIWQNIFPDLQGGVRWCITTKEYQPKKLDQRIPTKEYQRRQWEEGASGNELGRPNQRISITDTGLQANTDQVEQADISASED